MDDDWDLQAVVRGCTATTTTSSTSTTTTTATAYSPVGFRSFSSLQTPQAENDDNLLCIQDLLQPRNECFSSEDLYDLYKPFYTKSSSPPLSLISSQNMPLSPLSVLGNNIQDLSVQPQQQKVQLQQKSLLQTQNQPKKVSSSFVSKSGVHNRGGFNGATTHTQNPKSKRRKNQMKRVCQVPAEGLSSDVWSWRKYGQKPIKGSPYPRGYYRCSTSKGCLARKQVERNRSDPSMFIITYTAEHNHPTPTHRNSLAGSTRQKPTTSGDANKPTSSPPVSPADSLSMAPEKIESSNEEKEDIIEEDDDDFSISDIPMDDDFLWGLDNELTRPGPTYNNCFPDNFPAKWAVPMAG